jgi:hypothetical protein
VIETDFDHQEPTGGSVLVYPDARPVRLPRFSSFDKLIKPGPEGKVHTTSTPSSFSGPISKSVLVVSNDPERRADEPSSKALVKPFVDVAPPGSTSASRWSKAIRPHRT